LCIANKRDNVVTQVPVEIADRTNLLSNTKPATPPRGCTKARCAGKRDPNVSSSGFGLRVPDESDHIVSPGYERKKPIEVAHCTDFLPDAHEVAPLLRWTKRSAVRQRNPNVASSRTGLCVPHKRNDIFLIVVIEIPYCAHLLRNAEKITPLLTRAETVSR
jgi:hypothetical protein